ncbi:hypothetical protein SAMN02745824_0740 [Parasphingorhabdus marina DSM 22363]|uniref:Uncharacterized protein n=1 Tax=Parasphingorhabdus marina DSM 22363 TaxID=1123272 RepID=A0A1N6CQD1_9SPHN|nr:hypothetical protein [Parasphingorhabdus marina]SIN60778.1 hypothetical protein SAMN02745824_0740 [Parasphingorhabdus marina DSM 22363]
MIGKFIIRPLLAAAALVGIASVPAAAQCVVGKDQMIDPLKFDSSSYEIVHKDSGFAFPSLVAGFRRECEMTADFSGNNFEIGYVKEIEGQIVDIKIAVVHLEDLDAKNHYLIVKPDLLSHYSSASIMSEGDYFVSGRPDLEAFQGIFDGEKDKTPWHFSLTAIDYGYWDARLIASYPQHIDEPAQEALMELIKAFQWQTPTDKPTEDGEP